jgi:FixJ family two-component response regulator
MFTEPKSVVVVDDDVAVRSSLKFALELEGYQVRIYEGGWEMLAKENLERRGCLVLDQYMPGMSGVELVDRLRARDLDIPVVLITGKASADLRRSAAIRGIRDVLEKPLAGAALFECIRSAIATSRASPETITSPALRDAP